jgi:hypothetical protein
VLTGKRRLLTTPKAARCEGNLPYTQELLRPLACSPPGGGSGAAHFESLLRAALTDMGCLLLCTTLRAICCSGLFPSQVPLLDGTWFHCSRS